MSGDQPTTSFGDSTAQPPTPKQTPTSTTSFFPSPVFETPKIGNFHDHDNNNTSSHTTTTTPGPDWTPRFAEDFSVFNNTPGNLRGSQGPFSDFVAPFTSPTVEDAQLLSSSLSFASKHHKRPLSIGSIATEIHTTTHVHRLSIASSTTSTSNPSNHPLLPPVDPSKRLSSSPGSLVLAAFTSIAEDDREAAADREFSPDYYGDDQPPAASSPKVQAQVQNQASATTRAQKKARSDTTTTSTSGQTATPPPSARKGGRRIAPKLKTTAATTTTMQNDQGYDPQHQAPPNDFLNTPQQQQMATFMASPTDLFGYPMSAPATATAFADARSFWAGGDPNMSAMDVDFAAGAHVFHSPASMQRQLDSIDWAQANHANQAYMVAGAEAMQQQQQQQQHQHHQQHMHHVSMGSENDPKSMMQPTSLDTTSVDHQALYAGSYPTPVDDPFGIVSPNGGVNPGLLFSRPPSSSMDLMASAPPGANTTMALADATNFDPQQRQQQQQQQQHQRFPSSSAPAALQVSQSSPPQAMLNMGGPAVVQRQELRRSSSAKETVPRRKAGDRPSASSPVKSAGNNNRPGLSRSHSENRGPRLRGRASLPVLAPALKTSATTSALPQAGVGAPFSSPGAGLGITRSASFGGSGGGGRPTGRSSPIRMHHQQRQQQQHIQQQQQQLDDAQLHRLSSLTSIPEVNTPQSRASVKFTIDANGRARVETSAGEHDGPTPPSTLRRNQSARSLHSKSRWDSSSDNGDDSSSTDDEPIIIPSRTTSFALPDPVKPTIIGRGPLHSSQRSVSDRSTTSTSATMMPGGDAAYNNDPESEAETVMNDLPKGAGDAASELEKLRQVRQKRASFAGPSSSHGGGGGGLTSSSSANNLFGSVQRGLKFGGPLGSSNVGFPSGSGGSHSHHHNMQAVSPTTLTDASLPTPSSARSQSHHNSHGIRCICGRPDAPPNSDGFIVQCESCDMWLHGRCINITKRTLPSVYICAFCAHTPNVRNVRIPPPGAAASSPLAHKSFKTFR